MQLIKRRPIVLPVFKNGRWYDDFAVTGASDPGYSLIAGAKDRLIDGIQLRATTATNGLLVVPTSVSYNNFELETVAKRVDGEDGLFFSFRRLDGNNRWYVAFNNNNQAVLYKVVSSTITSMATVLIADDTIYRRINIKAIGPQIEVRYEGTVIMSVNNYDNAQYKGIILSTNNAPSIGVAKAMFQYLAIKPL